MTEEKHSHEQNSDKQHTPMSPEYSPKDILEAKAYSVGDRTVYSVTPPELPTSKKGEHPLIAKAARVASIAAATIAPYLPSQASVSELNYGNKPDILVVEPRFQEEEVAVPVATLTPVGDSLLRQFPTVESDQVGNVNANSEIISEGYFDTPDGYRWLYVESGDGHAWIRGDRVEDNQQTDNLWDLSTVALIPVLDADGDITDQTMISRSDVIDISEVQQFFKQLENIFPPETFDNLGLLSHSEHSLIFMQTADVVRDERSVNESGSILIFDYIDEGVSISFFGPGQIADIISRANEETPMDSLNTTFKETSVEGVLEITDGVTSALFNWRQAKENANDSSMPNQEEQLRDALLVFPQGAPDLTNIQFSVQKDVLTTENGSRFNIRYNAETDVLEAFGEPVVEKDYLNWTQAEMRQFASQSERLTKNGSEIPLSTVDFESFGPFVDIHLFGIVVAEPYTVETTITLDGADQTVQVNMVPYMIQDATGAFKIVELMTPPSDTDLTISSTPDGVISTVPGGSVKNYPASEGVGLVTVGGQHEVVISASEIGSNTQLLAAYDEAIATTTNPNGLRNAKAGRFFVGNYGELSTQALRGLDAGQSFDQLNLGGFPLYVVSFRLNGLTQSK